MINRQMAQEAEISQKAQIVADINATLKGMTSGKQKNQFRQISQRLMQEMQLQTDIVELNLSGIGMPSIYREVKPLLRVFKNVLILVITKNGLTSLDGLPSEWKLVSLDASKNNLGDSSLKKIGQYKNLKQLIIKYNAITKKQALNRIFCLKKLTQIQLKGNLVAQKQDYKKYLLQNMPNLKIDQKDFSSEDSSSSEEQQEDQLIISCLSEEQEVEEQGEK